MYVFHTCSYWFYICLIYRKGHKTATNKLINYLAVPYHILIHIVFHFKNMDNFVSNCSRYMIQPFVLEVLMSSFETDPSWKITIPRGICSLRRTWSPLQKLYIDWIFLFQSKILNFAMIGFHPISSSTFIRNFALYCNVKKFE